MKVKRVKNIDLKKIVKQSQAIQAQVGFFSSAKYEDGTQVAYVASIQEFGNIQKNIPPRPFMRPAKDNNITQWKNIFTKATTNAIKNNNSIKGAFDIIALTAEGDIKKAIKSVTKPALKTATVEARLRGKKQGKKVSLTVAKPLIDSGYMLASVTHEVTQ